MHKSKLSKDHLEKTLKFNNEQLINKVRKLRMKGCSYKELMKIFNVSRSTINKVLNKRGCYK